MNRPLTLTKGRYTARFAASNGDLQAAQRLRFLCFRSPPGPDFGDGAPDGAGLDRDPFDRQCRHVLVEETGTGRLVCCFRLLSFPDGTGIARSYSAQFYDLSAMTGFQRPMVEMGRFCIHPQWHDPDILRLAWGAMTAVVDREEVAMLFGCTSFRGTQPEIYADAFALLRDRHIAPRRWRPQVKADNIHAFAQALDAAPDLRRARSTLPPLLRSYLLMGGWVSDHAVLDPDLGTLHVFTGLEIGAVPAGRARVLRAVSR